MTPEQLNTIRLAHERSTADLNDFREAITKTVNTMFNDVVHSLELTGPLEVMFSSVGGAPIIFYDSYRVTISGIRAFAGGCGDDGNDKEFPELEPLGAAIIAAEVITMRYALATPTDIKM